MPVTIVYVCKSTPSQRGRSARNLYSLLADLPGPQRVVLGALDTVFKFHEIAGESGGANYSSRTIELNLKEFNQFHYRSRRVPAANQRWALATLKEEVIHFLDDHLSFTTSRIWRRAARRELKVKIEQRASLCRAQREHDSSDTWIKLSPEEYEADSTLFQRALTFVAGSASEAATELLADLLLVRDHLRAMGHSEAAIQETLRAAFPYTLSLALEFEKSLEQCASRCAMTQSPVDK